MVNCFDAKASLNHRTIPMQGSKNKKKGGIKKFMEAEENV
jgi:hypothetical protein